MPLQHFFIGPSYLGSRTIAAFRDKPPFGPQPSQSVAYFCPRCGEIWGRLAIEAGTWALVQRPCPKHGDGRLSDLSRYTRLESEFGDDWPPAAVKYEFERFLERAEKGLL